MWFTYTFFWFPMQILLNNVVGRYLESEQEEIGWEPVFSNRKEEGKKAALTFSIMPCDSFPLLIYIPRFPFPSACLADSTHASAQGNHTLGEQMHYINPVDLWIQHLKWKAMAFKRIGASDGQLQRGCISPYSVWSSGSIFRAYLSRLPSPNVCISMSNLFTSTSDSHHPH